MQSGVQSGVMTNSPPQELLEVDISSDDELQQEWQYGDQLFYNIIILDPFLARLSVLCHPAKKNAPYAIPSALRGRACWVLTGACNPMS